MRMNEFVWYATLAIAAFVPLSGGAAATLSAIEGRWILEAINGRPVTVGTEEIYFQLNGETITGYDGCNNFGGQITQPTQIRKSQRACPAGTLFLPLDLSNPLPQLDRAKITGGKLFLPLSSSQGEATFRRGS
jgi:hypothetical protein